MPAKFIQWVGFGKRSIHLKRHGFIKICFDCFTAFFHRAPFIFFSRATDEQIFLLSVVLKSLCLTFVDCVKFMFSLGWRHIIAFHYWFISHNQSFSKSKYVVSIDDSTSQRRNST